jgi:tetratricopeptide (TPR) repeat protein
MRCFSLAVLTGSMAFAQDADLPERLFRSGERAYATHAYPEALETWNQLIQQAPKSPFAAQALMNLARHQIDVEKQPNAALPLLERIKGDYLKTPWAAEAMLLRGQILAAKAHGPEDIKESMAEFNRVVDLFPDHPCVQQTRFELSRCYRLLGQWGRALQNDLDPSSGVARQSLLQAAETLDLMNDTTGCLRMLQSVRDRFPQSAEAREAAWRIQVRVKQRIQKPPLRSLGPWPEGRQKWLKTPTLLAQGPGGELYIYQDDLDRAALLKDGQLSPAGPLAKGAKAMLATPSGQIWLVTGKQGLVREEPSPGQGPGTPIPQAPSGLAQDGWGNLWISDARAPAIQIIPTEGAPRSVAVPGTVGLAPLATGGVAAASDANRVLLFLDADGQTRITIPYGKDLPAPFRTIVALASDPLGDVAALVDGDFEGVVLWGPDGAVLRSATYKTLGLSGKFRALAMDRQGALILADRANDLLIRLD